MNTMLAHPLTLTRPVTSRSTVPPATPDKPAYTVALLNRGNPDLNQNASKPLPSSRCYKKSVGSILEARRLCLEYIRKYRLGGSNWCGGLITNAKGRSVAQISYNGRVWEPAGRGASVKKPFPPILRYDRKQNQLIICYSHIYKELTVRCKELSGEFRFMDPLNDNQGLLIVLQPITAEGTISVQVFPTLYQGRQGWLATTTEPLSESQVQFV